jgi:hypothetical protein
MVIGSSPSSIWYSYGVAVAGLNQLFLPSFAGSSLEGQDTFHYVLYVDRHITCDAC